MLWWTIAGLRWWPVDWFRWPVARLRGTVDGRLPADACVPCSNGGAVADDCDGELSEEKL